MFPPVSEILATLFTLIISLIAIIKSKYNNCPQHLFTWKLAALGPKEGCCAHQFLQFLIFFSRYGSWSNKKIYYPCLPILSQIFMVIMLLGAVELLICQYMLTNL